MAQAERQYECVVFGATGYTGKYTAEHITTHLPTDLRWAIAGRSESKLKAVVGDLKALNPNRQSPSIEVAQLEKSDLVNLAKKTKVLISTVGPYNEYGTVVFEACAETGTHYLDVTGEVPWVYEMIQKYHDTAKRNGAIMIPQNGVESAPSDLMAWVLVSHLRETLGVGAREVVKTLHEFKGSASGGTLATVFSLFEKYSLSELARAISPWALCPVTPPQSIPRKPLVESLTGLRTVSDLGLLTDSLQGATDTVIVHRSWGLYGGGKLYGPDFHVSIYMKTRNALVGFGIHLAMMVGFLAILLPPVRWALRQFVYQPGQGPTKEQVKNDHFEWHAIAYADVADPNDPKRVFGRMRWEGSAYHLTGTFLAEAALTLARETTFANSLGGGVLTPATLGAPYIDRLRKAGLKVEVSMMP